MSQWAVMRDGKTMITASTEAHAREMLARVKAERNPPGEWTVVELKEDAEA